MESKKIDFNEYTQMVEFLYRFIYDDEFELTISTKSTEECFKLLKTIENIVESEVYSLFLSYDDYKDILTFISDFRYDVKDVTEEQFDLCNSLIEKIINKQAKAQEVERIVTQIDELHNQLNTTLHRSQRRSIEQLLNQKSSELVTYFNALEKECAGIDTTIINSYMDITDLVKSIKNEHLLLKYLNWYGLSLNEIVYLLSNVSTPAAIVRIFNQRDKTLNEIDKTFLDRTLNEYDKAFFESLIRSADKLIKTGCTEVYYNNFVYKVEISNHRTKFDTVLRSDSYQRLLCYLTHEVYQEPLEKESVKTKKFRFRKKDK